MGQWTTVSGFPRKPSEVKAYLRMLLWEVQWQGRENEGKRKARQGRRKVSTC